MSRLAVFVATGAHLSYIAVSLRRRSGVKWTGAGLIGTIEGLLLLPLLPVSPAPLAAVLILSTVAFSLICGVAEKSLGTHDDPGIILDEIVGFWFAAALLPKTWPALASAFVLFRLFDSVKLPPYRWLERLPGGWGVVLDDVGAGVFANIGARIILMVWGIV